MKKPDPSFPSIQTCELVVPQRALLFRGNEVVLCRSSRGALVCAHAPQTRLSGVVVGEEKTEALVASLLKVLGNEQSLASFSFKLVGSTGELNEARRLLLESRCHVSGECAITSGCFEAFFYTGSGRLRVREVTGSVSLPVIAIGASTGGTEAIRHILTHLPKEIPPILIAQHILADFSQTFVTALRRQCPFEVKEAAEGDEILAGRVLVAPGNASLTLRGQAGNLRVHLTPPTHPSGRLSIDVLFEAVATHFGNNAVGVLLTGMGDDGAAGLLTMRQAGALTIAQDESTSVIFGMPQQAIRRGAAATVLPLERIPQEILKRLIGSRAA